MPSATIKLLALVSFVIVASLIAGCAVPVTPRSWEERAIAEIGDPPDITPISLNALIGDIRITPKTFADNSVCVSFDPSETYPRTIATCGVNTGALGVEIWNGESDVLWVSLNGGVTRSYLVELRHGRNPTPMDDQTLVHRGVRPEINLLQANQGSLYSADMEIYYPEREVRISFSAEPEMGPIKDASSNVYEDAIWLSDKMGFTNFY